MCSLRFADRGTEGAQVQSPAQGHTAMVAEPGLEPKPLTEHEGNYKQSPSPGTHAGLFPLGPAAPPSLP